jgi:multimeric flavodoxin WrbA
VSGALKHFFDQVYYPVLDAAQGRPFGAWVHGNDDTTGAERAIETITTGLGWRRVAPTLSVVGTPDPDDLAACTELGGTVAATLLT